MFLADVDAYRILFRIYACPSALFMVPNGIRQVEAISVLFLDSVKHLRQLRQIPPKIPD